MLYDELDEKVSQLRTPGDHNIESSVTCVVTRFGLRNPLFLLFTYLDYRRVAKKAVHVPGHLRSAFLIENRLTCYSLSIWSDPKSITVFGGAVGIHVTAARRLFGRISFTPGRGPEIWSTKWTLRSISNNLNWSDFDLRGVVAQSAVETDERS
ncbi:MAG TPA: hypothetical protein VFE62_14720 [Gemmataceae bacterium]|jgi:hypothetical protein|nr:hypothetical protein [Gemmataceae bacterium]